ncbi:MAG: RHS repeat-associated core domain-containing protein [Reichenbachiella sp.]
MKKAIIFIFLFYAQYTASMAQTAPYYGQPGNGVSILYINPGESSKIVPINQLRFIKFRLYNETGSDAFAPHDNPPEIIAHPNGANEVTVTSYYKENCYDDYEPEETYDHWTAWPHGGTRFLTDARLSLFRAKGTFYEELDTYSYSPKSRLFRFYHTANTGNYYDEPLDGSKVLDHTIMPNLNNIFNSDMSGSFHVEDFYRTQAGFKNPIPKDLANGIELNGGWRSYLDDPLLYGTSDLSCDDAFRSYDLGYLHKMEVKEYMVPVTISLTKEYPSLWMGELMHPNFNFNEHSARLNDIFSSHVTKYWVSKPFYDFDMHDEANNIDRVPGSIPFFHGGTHVPEDLTTFYGNVLEFYRLEERELPFDCELGAPGIVLDQNLNSTDTDLSIWVMANTSKINDKNYVALYSHVLCREQDKFSSQFQPEVSIVNGKLVFNNLNIGGYLKFEMGDDDIIYKATLPEEYVIDVAGEPSYDDETGKVTAVTYESESTIFREDVIQRYNVGQQDWFTVEAWLNTLTNGAQIPSDESLEEGLHRYSYSTLGCGGNMVELGPKYFFSSNTRAIVIDPANNQEIYVEPNNVTFNINSAETTKLHFYTPDYITQVDTDITFDSEILTGGGSNRNWITVTRPIPEGLTIDGFFDYDGLGELRVNEADVTYGKLYKYVIDIENLTFNTPSFQFRLGNNKTYTINFLEYTAPASNEFQPIQDILDHLKLTINYKEDAIRFDESPSEDVSVVKTIFNIEDEEARTSGYASVDLNLLGLSNSEVRRLKPEDIVIEAIEKEGVGTISEVKIEYDHSYLSHLKLKFKVDGFSGLYTYAFVNFTYDHDPADLSVPTVVEKPLILNDHFFNHDIVGQKIQVNTTQPIIVLPGIRFEKGSVLVVNEITNDIFYEGLEYVENLNTVRSIARDDYGQIRQDSKAYFEESGELLQTQTKNFDHHLVLASEVIKDEFGRPVGQTLPAPVRYGHRDVPEEVLESATYDNEDAEVIPGFDTFFEYAPTFVDRNKLNATDFAGNKLFNPDAYVDTRSPVTDATAESSLINGYLGWYYSSANAGSSHELGEDHVPQTQYPYSRTIYYDDASGETLTQVPAGDYVWKDKNGSKRNNSNQLTYAQQNYVNHSEDYESAPLPANGGYSDGAFTEGTKSPIMGLRGQKEPILDQGQDHTLMTKYLQVRNSVFAGDNLNTQYALHGGSFSYNRNGYKRRAYDYKGNQNIAYFDANDNLLVSRQIYIEPLQLGGGASTSEITTFTVYDNANRLRVAFTPKGTADLLSSAATASTAEQTTYNYNSRGWLLSMEEPDAGTSRYIYRRDGLIRFSQNAKQLENGQFSYTNYDHLNRPIESGVANYSAYGVSGFTDAALIFAANDRTDGYSEQANDPDRFDMLRTYYDTEYTHFYEGDISTIEVGGDLGGGEGGGDGDVILYINGEEADDLTEALMAIPLFLEHQSFLGGAVSWSETFESNTDEELPNSRTVYSYDERGRVAWLSQYVPDLGMKRIRYIYGPMDNIIEVAYQPGLDVEDKFFHTYEYNNNGQLARAYASEIPLLNYRYLKIDEWRKDEYLFKHLIAEYDYYKHGPLKSVKLGGLASEGSENPGDEVYLQQLDYVYSITGGLKSINDITDATQQGALDDAFAMQLQYFNGDYLNANDNIGAFSKGTASGGTQTADMANLDLETDYTGNIKAMVWAHNLDGESTFDNAQAFMYNYDEMGQLRQAVFGNLDGTNIDHAGSFGVRNLTYDLNGNIKTLRREDIDGAVLESDMGGPSLTHDFDYKYEASGPNQLSQVVMSGGDIFQENEYNSIGQLTDQIQLGTSYSMAYDVTGKMKSFTNQDEDMSTYFTYNTLGFRDRKLQEMYGELVGEYYVRDAAGNIMTTYKRESEYDPPELQGFTLYGANRVGEFNWDEGLAKFEIKDHLGNVRGLISKPETEEQPSTASIQILNPTGGDIDNNVTRVGAQSCKEVILRRENDYTVHDGDESHSYRYYWQDHEDGEALLVKDEFFRATRSDTWYLRLRITDNNLPIGHVDKHQWHPVSTRVIVTLGDCNALPSEELALDESLDYYPFGMTLPTSPTNGYTRGYQAEFSEKDEETGFNHFQLRDYEAILGRWMVIDPYRQYASPYIGMGNNPVIGIDPDGGECKGCPDDPRYDFYRQSSASWGYDPDLVYDMTTSDGLGVFQRLDEVVVSTSALLNTIPIGLAYEYKGFNDFMNFWGRQIHEKNLENHWQEKLVRTIHNYGPSSAVESGYIIIEGEDFNGNEKKDAWDRVVAPTIDIVTTPLPGGKGVRATKLYKGLEIYDGVSDSNEALDIWTDKSIYQRMIELYRLHFN